MRIVSQALNGSPAWYTPCPTLQVAVAKGHDPGFVLQWDEGPNRMLEVRQSGRTPAGLCRARTPSRGHAHARSVGPQPGVVHSFFTRCAKSC